MGDNDEPTDNATTLSGITVKKEKKDGGETRQINGIYGLTTRQRNNSIMVENWYRKKSRRRK